MGLGIPSPPRPLGSEELSASPPTGFFFLHPLGDEVVYLQLQVTFQFFIEVASGVGLVVPGTEDLLHAHWILYGKRGRTVQGGPRTLKGGPGAP